MKKTGIGGTSGRRVNMLNYKDLWLAHLRPESGLPLFPRDMSSRDMLYIKRNGGLVKAPLTRSPIVSREQYLASILSGYLRKDMYIQVFSDWQIQHRFYDTIFFEVDIHSDESLDAIAPEMFNVKRLIEDRLNKFGIAYRCMFTGGRGFHFYLDFSPVYIRDYKATALKFLEEIGIIDIVDTAVVEPARIARLPYTKHLKTGLYAIMIPPNAGMQEVLKASRTNVILQTEYKRNDNILRYLDLEAELSSSAGTGFDKHTGKYTGWFPECVIRVMEKLLVNQHATHDERKHLAGYLMHFGYSDDEILEFFRPASDFNRDVALSQIRSLHGYHGYACRNVRTIMRDLCPGTCRYIIDVASGEAKW